MCKNCEKGYRCPWHNVGGIKGNRGIGGIGKGKGVISQYYRSLRMSKTRQDEHKTNTVRRLI